MKFKSEEEARVWLQLYCAVVSGRTCYVDQGTADSFANQATNLLKEYNNRLPPPSPTEGPYR